MVLNKNNELDKKNILFTETYFCEQGEIGSVKGTGDSQKIVEILEADAQRSIGDIAEEVGLSEPTVRKYIREMEADGTILGYSAEVDPRKRDGRVTSLVGVDTRSDGFLHVAEALKEMEEVRKLFTSTGDHELMAEVVTGSEESLHEAVSTIDSIDGVDASHPAVLNKRIK